MATAAGSVLTDELLRTQLVPQILAAMPADWRGTTFNNSNLLGREKFSERLQALLVSKAETTLGGAGAITSDDLTNLGNAEDYMRVATNVCTLYENVLALGRGASVEHVFSFASVTMPILSVVFTSGGAPVHVYHGSAPIPLSNAQITEVAKLGGDLTFHRGSPTAGAHKGATVLALEDCMPVAEADGLVDGVIGDNALFITNAARIVPSSIMTARKRMAVPITTPAAVHWLQNFSGLEATADAEAASANEVASFNAHLQTMNGTAVDIDAEPVTCQAGLPTIASLWLALEGMGGADILMCSTCYGGSSELTDLCLSRNNLRKSTFHIQGDTPVDQGIQEALDTLAADPSSLKPTTVLFVEIPTNPDQKMPNIAALAASCEAYQASTGKQVLLLVDTTFAPASEVLSKVAETSPDLQAMIFVSMSKSVSRGETTAGALIANHTTGSKAFLSAARNTATMLDTTARKDQMLRLCRNHEGVEDRCQNAYEGMVSHADTLRAAVKKHTGHDMLVTHVAPEHAAAGYTSATISFNLPSPVGATAEVNEALAQRFVDLLTEDASRFKPCVSFGQDNGLVYCTVPATSTQGAIKAEDKAKQAKGGVQLARLSFPPTTSSHRAGSAEDLSAVAARIEYACAAIYA
jgi:cysteine synthase A